jgi:hypothetical protein
VISDLVALGADLLVAVDDLRETADQALGPPLDDPAVWADAAAALPGHLLVTYLEEQAPVVYGILRFCGVIRDAESPGGGEREVFSAQALVDLAGDPVGTVSGYYAWGEPGGMRHREFVAELDSLLSALGLRVRTAPARRDPPPLLARACRPSRHRPSPTERPDAVHGRSSLPGRDRLRLHTRDVVRPPAPPWASPRAGPFVRPAQDSSGGQKPESRTRGAT